VSAGWKGRLYVFGGLAFDGEAAPAGVSRHLRDAYCFSPSEGWRRLADLPRGNAGATGPAMELPGKRLAFWGGLDASWAELSRTMKHFETGFLIYDTVGDAWTMLAQDALDPVSFPGRLTATVTAWNGGYAIIGGETAPRVRTTTTPWVDFR